nr:helix-turn-helix domain-containing protein [Kineococcus aurantiacus]
MYRLWPPAAARAYPLGVGSPYHQFCPVAKALELLDERWTLLVVRELLVGSDRFSQIRRGNPRMSPTLLSRRLRQLERAGVVERRQDARGITYHLTPAGRELEPVVTALAVWGTRWVPELTDSDVDPRLLVWDLHRNLDAARVPVGRTVVRFDFADAAPRARTWWLVLDSDGSAPVADVCDRDPGAPVDVTVSTTVRALTDVWRGARDWRGASAHGDVVVDGPAALRRALPGWFVLPAFAAVPRPGPAGAQPARKASNSATVVTTTAPGRRSAGRSASAAASVTATGPASRVIAAPVRRARSSARTRTSSPPSTSSMRESTASP